MLDILNEALQENMPSFSVVNGVGSRIAQMTKVGAYQNAGPEMGITSTKSFATQVTVIALIAWYAPFLRTNSQSSWFAEQRESASKSKRIELMQVGILRMVDVYFFRHCSASQLHSIQPSERETSVGFASIGHGVV